MNIQRLRSFLNGKESQILGLNEYDRQILFVIASDIGRPFPIGEMARTFGISPFLIQRSIDRLVDMGILRVLKGPINHYSICLDFKPTSSSPHTGYSVKEAANEELL